jgi:hypothetical protein
MFVVSMSSRQFIILFPKLTDSRVSPQSPTHFHSAMGCHGAWSRHQNQKRGNKEDDEDLLSDGGLRMRATGAIRPDCSFCPRDATFSRNRPWSGFGGDQLRKACGCTDKQVSFAAGYRNGLASIEREKLEFDRRYQARLL